MAEVRDFASYAEKVNNGNYSQRSSEDEPSYKEKIRNHKLAVLFRTAGIAFVVVLLVALIYLSWRDKEYSEALLENEAPITNGLDSKVLGLGGHVIQYSKDGVSCIGPSGQVLWNQTYEMQNPIARTCGSVVAVGDYNGHNIYVNSTSGSMGVIDTNLPIRDFCV